MTHWVINESALRAELARVTGRDEENVDVALPALIARRIAAEDGDEKKLTHVELHRAVEGALKDPRHFLNLPERNLTATTLVALERLCTKNTARTESLSSGSVDGSETGWAHFLEQFLAEKLSPWERLTMGALALDDTLRQYGELGAALFNGGAVFLINAGDSADMRLRVLAERAVTLAERILDKRGRVTVISPGLGEQITHSARTATARGISIENAMSDPGTFTEEHSGVRRAVSMLKHALAEAHINQDFVFQMGTTQRLIRDNLESVLEFIATYGQRKVELEAREALIALRTTVYETRSLNPVGVPSLRFPAIDGTNQTEVIAFLKLLGIESTSFNKEQVWQYWKSAWEQQDLHAGDIAWDLDRTLWQYKLRIYDGVDHIQLDPVVIKLVALALRDRRPNVIVTNAIRARIADVANHPAFAAFRFAFFLRMPDDPHVTVEEMATMRTITSYEELTEGRTASMVELLRSFGRDLRKLAGGIFGGDESHGISAGRLVGAALSILQSIFGLRIWEGPKLTGTLRDRGKEVPKILVDDNKRHAEDFVYSGGMGAVVVPRLERGKTLNGQTHSVFNTFEEARELYKRLNADPRANNRIVTLRREDTALTSARFPYVEDTVTHARWAYKVWEGWVASGLRMAKTKIRLIARLLFAGKLREAREEARKFLHTDVEALAAAQWTEDARPGTAGDCADCAAAQSAHPVPAPVATGHLPTPTAPTGPAEPATGATQTGSGSGQVVTSEPPIVTTPKNPGSGTRALGVFVIGNRPPVFNRTPVIMGTGKIQRPPLFDGTTALADPPPVLALASAPEGQDTGTKPADRRFKVLRGGLDRVEQSLQATWRHRLRGHIIYPTVDRLFGQGTTTDDFYHEGQRAQNTPLVSRLVSLAQSPSRKRDVLILVGMYRRAGIHITTITQINSIGAKLAGMGAIPQMYGRVPIIMFSAPGMIGAPTGLPVPVFIGR